MFESTKVGRSVSKDDFKEQQEALRTELLEVQRELKQSNIAVIVLISGVEAAGERMPGSVAVALHAAAQGVQIIRVHDVVETVQALALWRALTSMG